jgi:hypothetical protein
MQQTYTNNNNNNNKFEMTISIQSNSINRGGKKQNENEVSLFSNG